MERISEDQISLTLKETIKAVVRELYTAIEHKDVQRMGKLDASDVFVLGAGVDAVSIGREQFIGDLHSQFEHLMDKKLRV